MSARLLCYVTAHFIHHNNPPVVAIRHPLGDRCCYSIIVVVHPTKESFITTPGLMAISVIMIHAA